MVRTSSISSPRSRPQLFVGAIMWCDFLLVCICEYRRLPRMLLHSNSPSCLRDRRIGVCKEIQMWCYGSFGPMQQHVQYMSDGWKCPSRQKKRESLPESIAILRQRLPCAAEDLSGHPTDSGLLHQQPLESFPNALV